MTRANENGNIVLKMSENYAISFFLSFHMFLIKSNGEFYWKTVGRIKGPRARRHTYS